MAWTTWIRRFKEGDDEAVGRLWNECGGEIARMARRDLGGVRRRLADEEDIAQSAFLSLWRGAVKGRFPLLRNSFNLWPLLRVLIRRKAVDLRQHQARLKRGGGLVRGESAVQPRAEANGLARVAGYQLAPDALACAAENRERLLARLSDGLRRIALLKAEGYTDGEIADALSMSRATVARKLALIRRIWRSEERP